MKKPNSAVKVQKMPNRPNYPGIVSAKMIIQPIVTK